MWGKFLQGRPLPLPWPKFLVTRMLTRDLFAVANLLVYYNFKTLKVVNKFPLNSAHSLSDECLLNNVE